VVTVEASVVIVGIALVLGHGAWTGLAGRRTEVRRARGRAALQAVLDGEGPPGRRRLAALSRRVRLEVLMDVAPSLQGFQREALTALAGELGILASAEAKCGSRWWWRRLHGARVCTSLGGGITAVPALLQDRRPEVRAQAAQWVVRHPDDRLISLLLRMLDADDSATRFAVKDSLIRIGRSVTPALVAHLSVRADRSLGPALEVAAALADPTLLPAALALCVDEVARTRALAAALAGAIGGGPAVEVLMRMLGDDTAEVRAAAARALGKAEHWPATSSVAELLGDPSWDVRLQAALALRTLGSPGILFLRRAASGEDPGGAEAARHLLDLPDSALRTL